MLKEARNMLNYNTLEEAFMFVSSGMQHENYAVINKKTGEIHYRGDVIDSGDLFADDDSEDEDDEEFLGDNYVYVPHKNDLDLGRKLVFDFVAQYLPDMYNEVERIFRSRGAYSRFKALLDAENQLQNWYNYENERTKAALLEWCKDNGLEVQD